MLFVLTGPESTGKSLLARQLAEQLQLPRVDEVARHYLANKRGAGEHTYQPSDLLNIAAQQQLLERSVVQNTAAHNVIADTDLQVLYIWWQERFGPVPEVLSKAYTQQSPRYYLLCAPDLPWEPDVLRENPDDRDRLLALYAADLQRRRLPFSEVQGVGQARLDCALHEIKQAQLTR